MSAKRAYFGDLRLWYYGRSYVETMRARTEVVHDGIDREEALVVSANPNFEGHVDVETVFAPSSAFSQADFRSTVAAMLDALRSRAGMANAQHPLVWIDDVALASVLNGTGPYSTASAHGLSVGDRVLIRALGEGDYDFAAVATTPTSTTFTTTSLVTGSAFAPASGHDVLVVDRAWPSTTFREFAPIPEGSGGPIPGDFFAERAKYRFRVTTREGVYTRSTVDLDLGGP